MTGSGPHPLDLAAAARQRIARLSGLLGEARADRTAAPPDDPARGGPGTAASPEGEREDLRAALAEAVRELDLARWVLERGSDAYLVTDQHGAIRQVNRAAADLFLIPQRFLAGRPLVLLVDPPEVPAFRWLVNCLTAEDALREASLRLRNRTGVAFPARLTVQRVQRGPDAPVELHWLVRDVSAPPAADTLDATQQFLREQLAGERAVRSEAERRQHEAEVIARLAREMDPRLAPDDLLRILASGSQELCEATGARVAWREGGAAGAPGRLAGVGMLGHRIEGPGERGWFGLEELAWREGAAQHADDVTRDARLDAGERELARRAGIASQLAVPLRLEGTVVGVVSVCSGERGRFTERDRAALERLAGQAAAALGQAALLEAEAARRRELEEGLAAARHAEVSLGKLFESGIAGMVVATEDRITAANAAFLAMTGYTREDVAAGRLAWRKLLVPEHARRDGHALERLRTTGECAPFVTACRRKDGGRCHVMLGGVTVATAPFEWLSLVIDVSEQKRSESDLRLARHEAEAVNRAKDEFLATLGHELRNPLAAIRNAITVLEAKGAPDEQAIRLHAIIARQVHHVTRLVDDLLDLSRVISGKVRLHREPFDLHGLVEHALAGLAQAGRTREHRVACEGEPTVVHADPTRIEQVVQNLLDNAFKYTPPGGRVAVSVRRTEQEAVLSVADSGVGLTAEMVPRIFELFAQEGRALDRAQGGLGLGLTLVRRLVTLHGGTVGASSAGPGRGSTFTVRLPMADVGHDAAAPPAGRPAEAGPPRRVLVVDDHEDTRVSLRMLLERAGHTVAEAADGPGGLEAALRGDADLALVDVGLPGLDGYELARRLRAAPARGEVTLIAVTGFGSGEDRQRALDAGFDGYLVKPVDPRELEDLLRDPPKGRAAAAKPPGKAERRFPRGAVRGARPGVDAAG